MCIRDRFEDPLFIIIMKIKDCVFPVRKEEAAPYGILDFFGSDSRQLAQYIPVSYTHLDVYKRQIYGGKIVDGDVVVIR